MNLFKKVMATIALSTMLIANVASVSAYSTDSVDAANELASQGIINDHSDDSALYNLGQNVLRQEIAAVTMGVAGLDKKSSCDNLFDDVSATTPNTWACLVVETLRDGDMIAANANFNPESNITKAEALGMLVKAAFGNDYSYDASLSSSWQEQLVSFAADAEITEAFTDYDTPATRGWVFEIAVSSMDASTYGDDSDLLGDLFGDLDDTGTDTGTGTGTDTGTDTGDTTTTGSDLMAELSPETPAAASIPENAQSVVYTVFDVTAGSSDVTIDSVTLERAGLGSRTDFDKVWIARNGVVVSNDKTINSTDTVVIPMTLTVKAGETETLQVVASMQAAGTKINRLNVIEITADTDVADVNLVGSEMTTVNYAVAELTFQPKGSPTTVDAGNEGEVIGEFKLSETETNSKKGADLYTIRLKANGGVDLTDNLANLALYVDGDMVSKETIIDGDYVTFVLDDLFIEDGKSKNFEIKADVLSGDDGDTLSFQLKDKFDINANEEGANFGAAIDDTAGTVLSTYTLDAGKVTLSQDTSNPSSEDYVNDTDDVEVMVVKVDSDQDITVDTIRVFIETGTSAITKALFETYYENFRLYRNDVLIDSTDVVVDGNGGNVNDGGAYLEFDASTTLSDNDLLTLKVDLTNLAVPGTLRTRMNNVGTSAGSSASLLDVEYVSDGETVAQTKLSGTSSSNSVDVVLASDGVSIVRNDGYSNGETFLAGENDAVLMSGIINAGNSSSLEVRKMNFDFDVTASFYYNFTNMKLLIDGTQVGSTEDLSAVVAPDGTVTFDSINTTIAKNGQATFSLVSAMDTSTPTDTLNVTLDVSDSVFYDSNDNDVTIPTGDVFSPNLALATNALLTVDVDGNTPDEAIIVADTDNVELAKYKLTATDGDVRFKDLYFVNTFAATDDRVQLLKLKVDGVTVDSRVPSAGQIHFIVSGNDLVVPKDDSVVITLEADFNSITDDLQTNGEFVLGFTDLVAETAATSKDLTQIENAEVVAGGDAAGLNNAFVAVDSGNHYSTSDIVQDGMAFNSDPMYLRKTQPTVATVDLGTSNLSAGEQTIYEFTVTADSAEDVEVGQFNFNVSTGFAGATTIGSYKLYVNGSEVTVNDLGNGDAVLDADAAVNGYEGGADSAFTFINGKEEVVSSGTSKTFELKATIAGAPLTDNDYVSVKLVEDAKDLAAFGTNKAASVAAAASNFIWSDNAGSPHSETTTDWFNGYKVIGLDTTTTTLTK